MKLRWAYFALVVCFILAWAINRGILVWAETVTEQSGQTHKRCYYLFPSGVAQDNRWFVTNHCRLLFYE